MSHGSQPQYSRMLATQLALKDLWQTYTTPVNVPASTKPGDYSRATSYEREDRTKNRPIANPNTRKSALLTPHGSEDRATSGPLVSRSENRTVIGSMANQKSSCVTPHGSEDLTTKYPLFLQRTDEVPPHGSQDLTTKKSACVTSSAKENRTEISQRSKGIMNNQPMTSYQNIGRTRQRKEFNRRSILRNLVTPIVCTILLSSFCANAANSEYENPVEDDVTSRLARRALGVDPILTKADNPKGIPKTLPSLGYDLKGDCDVIALEERWLDAHILSSYDESESLVLRPANIKRVGLMHFRSNCSFDKSEIVCYGKMLTPLRARETSGVCSIEIPSFGRTFSFPLLKREV